jgi:cell division transport system permease protein
MAKKEVSGAKASSVTFKAKFTAWKKDHQRVVKDSLLRLLKKPLSSLMTWAVIGIALALPVGFYVALGNVQQLSGRFDGNAQLSLFLHQRVSAQSVEQLTQELSSWREIKELTVISKEEALEEFQAISGLGDVLGHLQENPLPMVIEITPAPEYSDSKSAEALLERLRQLPPVELAQLDLQWVQRLNAMLALGQRMALGLVVLLSLGVLLIIGNTIRLEVENRREEIMVTKLVGATDSFVRRPFLYTGIWYGFGGGIIASIIIMIGLAMLNKPAAILAGLYQSDYQLLGLSFADMISLWMMAALLGFFGAWFSLSRHLDELEPH